ncbi:hypothetical protein GCM10027187_71080 [Streptosporangium sandarakinum]
MQGLERGPLGRAAAQLPPAAQHPPQHQRRDADHDRHHQHRDEGFHLPDPTAGTVVRPAFLYKVDQYVATDGRQAYGGECDFTWTFDPALTVDAQYLVYGS